MRKIVYVLLLTAFTAMTVVSCTEEQVAPKHKDAPGGSGSTDPI